MTHPNDPSNYNDGVECCDACEEPLEFGVVGLPIYRFTPMRKAKHWPQLIVCDSCADKITVTNYKLIECISGYGGKA